MFIMFLYSFLVTVILIIVHTQHYLRPIIWIYQMLFHWNYSTLKSRENKREQKLLFWGNVYSTLPFVSSGLKTDNVSPKRWFLYLSLCMTLQPRRTSNQLTIMKMWVSVYAYLRWPTCISLAIFGEEKSTTTLNFFSNGGGRTPVCSSAVNTLLPWVLLNVTLMKPGPATSIRPIHGFCPTCSTIFLATSYGAILTPT